MKFKLLIMIMILMGISFFAIGLENREENVPRDASFLSEKKSEFIMTKLGIFSEEGCYDITSDNTNTIHLVWLADDGMLHYGQIAGNAVVNVEVVPESADVRVEFIRPRITARPDGGAIHLSWMFPKPGDKLVHVWKNTSGWHREIVWSGNSISVPNAVEDLTGKMHLIGQVWTTTPTFHSKIKYWFKEAAASDYNNGWTLIEGELKWRDTAMFVDKEGGVHGVFKSGRDPGKYVYCPNGGSLIDSVIEDIPIPAGEVCVSFGDLFVDGELNVHHAHLSYNTETVYYEVKKAGTDEWTKPSMVSDGPLELCDLEAYEHAWPAVAADRNGTVYVAWADMPCPEREANRITLATRESDSDEWKREVVTIDADTAFFSKPALTANEMGVYLVYRDWTYELVLYSLIQKELYISSPSPNQNICNDVSKIEVKAQIPTEISTVDIYVDEKLLGTVNAVPFEIPWDISRYELGDHTIKAVGTKTNGELLEDEITVDMNCPPIVTIANLVSNGTVNGIADIIVKTGDDKGMVEKVDFVVDGKLKDSVSEAPFIFRWNTNAYNQGSNHNLKAIVYDESGVTSEDTVKVMKWPLFPPVGLSAEIKVNRTLFIIENYTYLSWQSNPQNSTFPIVAYRIYYVANGVREFVAEVDANTFEYVHRNASTGEDEYIYAITAVGGNGKESYGDFTILEKPLTE